MNKIYCKFKKCDPKLCEHINNLNLNNIVICVFEHIENNWSYIDGSLYTTTKSKFELFGIFNYLTEFRV